MAMTFRAYSDLVHQELLAVARDTSVLRLDDRTVRWRLGALSATLVDEGECWWLIYEAKGEACRHPRTYDMAHTPASARVAVANIAGHFSVEGR